MRFFLFAAMAVWGTAALPTFAAELCIVPSSDGHNRSLDCEDVWRDNVVLGFGTEAPPCGNQIDTCPNTHTPQYDVWTLSASDYSPFDNTADSVSTVYLWYACMTDDEEPAVGLLAAEFGIAGDIEVASFTPRPGGFLNSGTDTDLRLVANGCPGSWHIAGWFEVEMPTPISQLTWGRIKAVYR